MTAGAAPVRRLLAGLALIPAALGVTACGGGLTAAAPPAHRSRGIVPVRVVPGPRSLLAAAVPQPNGIMWALAGPASAGLFNVDSTTGKVSGSVSVSAAARSVAESTAGVLGLALGTSKSGALELLDGRTTRLIHTVPLPAPARQVVVGSDGTTFYVLAGWPGSASVTVLNSQTGKVAGTVPVPADTVSVVPDIAQTTLYVLEHTGLVSQVSIASGQIIGKFKVGTDGESAALSPDGSTLYVLKGTSQLSNVAVVDTGTESVRRVLPAPTHCLQLLVSASGNQLFEVVGAPGYGNIQVFPA